MAFTPGHTDGVVEMAQQGGKMRDHRCFAGAHYGCSCDDNDGDLPREVERLRQDVRLANIQIYGLNETIEDLQIYIEKIGGPLQ